MAQKEIPGRFLTGVLVGAATLYGAQHLNVYKKAGSDFIDYAQTRLDSLKQRDSRFTLDTTPALIEREKLMWDSNLPSAEVIHNAAENKVSVLTYMPDEYNHYGFGAWKCTGIIIRDAKEEPLIVTAKHCFPSEIKAEDGNIYSSSNTDGSSMLQSQATNFTEIKIPTHVNNYYITEKNQETDVVILSPDNASLVKTAGLSLRITEPHLGEHATLITDDPEGKLNIPSLNVISKRDGMIKFLSVIDSETECISGTSGSAIIDNTGAILGILTTSSSDLFRITDAYAELYQLPPELVGLTGHECNAVTSQTILGLIRNP